MLTTNSTCGASIFFLSFLLGHSILPKLLWKPIISLSLDCCWVSSWCPLLLTICSHFSCKVICSLNLFIVQLHKQLYLQKVVVVRKEDCVVAGDSGRQKCFNYHCCLYSFMPAEVPLYANRDAEAGKMFLKLLQNIFTLLSEVVRMLFPVTFQTELSEGFTVLWYQ